MTDTMHRRRAAFRSSLAAAAFWLALTTTYAQGPQGSSAARAPQPLPSLTDWFLATGRWSEDPQLYVREFGDGTRPVVVLHGGWGAEHSGLVDAVRPLGERYRFIFYDQRGSLRSPVPDALITFDQHVEDVERLRQELALETLTLVGHSMGAVLASAYASKYPDRVAQLILLSPARLRDPLPEGDRAAQHEGYLASQAYLARPDVAAELERHGLTRAAPPLSSREETAKYRITLAGRMLSDVRHWRRLTGGRALFKAHVNALTTKTYPAGGWDFVEEFRRRTYPVGIIIGDHDFVDFGAPLLRKWAGEVPRLELRVVPNAGHLIWVDQPERVSEELDRLLGRLSGRPVLRSSR